MVESDEVQAPAGPAESEIAEGQVAPELTPSRNIGLDLLRVTEATAMAAGRWIGLGDQEKTHAAATLAMTEALASLDIDGQIVVGEEGRLGQKTALSSGAPVGTGSEPIVDVVVDPIDGTKLVIAGHPGAISLIGVAPRDRMWSPPAAAVYMDKIVVDREAAAALVPECMDAPAGWTLALVARVKDKPVRDMTVVLLDRPRHRDLVDEIRKAGARVLMRDEGDASGALEAAIEGSGADLLIGAGGVSEGVIAACAVKALGGAMLGRLAPQSEEERRALLDAGFDPDRILTGDELVAANEIFFAATGITESPLLKPIRYRGNRVQTHSLLLRAETGTRRFIQTEHVLAE